jgi:TP901 family phage tail tape measure protein
MILSDIRELTYNISYELEDSALSKAMENESKLDEGFKTAAISATKVDENLSKAASSASKASNNSKKIDDELKKSSSSAKTVSDHMKEIGDYSEKSNSMVGNLKNTLLSLGVGFSVASAVKAGTDSFVAFDQTMANVRATMGDISDKEYKDLENAALEYGSKTEYSSKQVAEAMFYTASAGFDAKTQMEVLPSVLNLASSGQIDLAKSSDILTTSMSSLKLDTKDVPVLVDQMAVAAQASLTDIDHMGDAITNVGGSARNANMSTADLNTELAILANSGKKGADGGVALRNTLLNLTAPNDQVSKLIKELGVHITDTTGSIRPFNDILVDLKGSMKDLNQGTQMGILEKIGGKENVEALNILLSGSGEEFEKYKQQILDSSGAAEKMAEVQRDTLGGSFKLLKNTIDATFIKNINDSELGKTLKDLMKNLTTMVPNAANEINYLIKLMKDNKSVILGVISALGSFSIILKVVGWIGQFSKALTLFKAGETAVNGIGKAMTLFTNPVFLVVLAIGALIGILIYAYKTNDSFKNTVDNLFTALGSLAKFIMNTVVPILAGPFSAIWDTIKALISNFITIVQGLFEILSGLINFIVGVFTGNWKQAWEGVKEIFMGIIDVLKGAFAGFINFFTGGINTAIGLVNGIASKIPGIGSSLKIPEIPRVEFKNAAGTNFSPGGVTLVGEYGPEIVNMPRGSQVKTANETSSILNQSIPTSQPFRSRNSNVNIKSSPIININIKESKNPRDTASEVERVLREKFGNYFDDKFAILTSQLGLDGAN